jgi:hypothetical protein
MIGWPSQKIFLHFIFGHRSERKWKGGGDPADGITKKKKKRRQSTTTTTTTDLVSWNG